MLVNGVGIVLTPCPWCNSTQLLKERDNSLRIRWIACVSCECHGPMVNEETADHPDAAGVAWNSLGTFSTEKLQSVIKQELSEGKKK